MQKIFSELSELLSSEIIKYIIIFCVIGLIFSGVFNYILSFYFDFDVESIKIWVQGYNQYAPIAYIFLVALAIVISPIPSTPLGIVAGITFGTFLGIIGDLGRGLGFGISIFNVIGLPGCCGVSPQLMKVSKKNKANI